jgi:hypothetical protein
MLDASEEEPDAFFGQIDTYLEVSRELDVARQEIPEEAFAAAFLQLLPEIRARNPGLEAQLTKIERVCLSRFSPLP